MANINNVNLFNIRMKLLLENYLEAKINGQKEGYDIKLVNPDIYEAYYIMFKPKAGLYKDQTHILEMKTSYGDNVKYSYPIHAPKIVFLTKIFHSNISSEGSICLDFLKEESKWTPTANFSSIITNILLLLDTPNPSSPLNSEAAKKYSECQKIFNSVKTNHLSVEKMEAYKSECFESFISLSNNISNANNLQNYVKWFPQLDKNFDAQLFNKEIEELSEQLEELKLKKKKKAEVQKNEVQKIEEPKSEDSSKDTTESKPKKKFDTSKFAKYRDGN